MFLIQAEQHVFVVEASDQPSDRSKQKRSRCTVLVKVVDVNDNSPTFSRFEKTHLKKQCLERS
jgi:hypothetical protein